MNRVYNDYVTGSTAGYCRRQEAPRARLAAITTSLARWRTSLLDSGQRKIGARRQMRGLKGVCGIPPII